MSPAEIISSISNKFIEARECGELLFFPSTICKHEDLGVQFEVRLCPALQKKPVAEVDLAKEKIKEGTQFDAFTPPYNPSLHVGDLEDDGGTNYVVLLNKFALLPDHFLLVTKEFQSQTSPLMPPDLVQTYFLLAEARKLGKQYFAFYNCGEHSGASQPRKHIQFIPVHDKNPPIEVLAKAANLEVQGFSDLFNSLQNIAITEPATDKPFSLTALPYAHYVFRFPNQLPSYTQDKIEQVLSSAFLSLLDLVVSTVRLDPEYPPGRPSYNVLITLEHMHLIPRKQDVYTIPETGYKVSVNALGFAGMLLVKSNEELKALEKESVGTVLLSLGLKNVHKTQIGDITAEVE